MAKDDDEDCARRPCGESGEPECGANIASPEICEWVKNEPVDWDGKVQKEDEKS